MSTLKLVASIILGACVFMGAIAAYTAAGAAHGITIGVMGVLALLVVQMPNK